VTVHDLIATALESTELDWSRDGDAYMVTLPGTHKLKTTCRLVVGDHGVRIEAFVMRAPDENVEGVYGWLLRHNSRLYGVAWTIDGAGDIYLVGRMPLHAVNAEEVDRLLGSVLQAADGSFDTLVKLGFAEAIRREYQWRVDRGESTENLRAFADVVERRGGAWPG
jgi:hypothetical protein